MVQVDDELKPGQYVIMPSRYNKGDLGKFFVSVWLNYPVDISPLKEFEA